MYTHAYMSAHTYLKSTNISNKPTSLISLFTCYSTQIMIRNSRGFKLGGRKLVKIFKWVINRRTNPTNYQRLTGQIRNTKPISKICDWIRSLKFGSKRLCFRSPKPGYSRVGHDPVDTKTTINVPKGHLAVYVGVGEDDTQRILAPVIYFNHPLFGDLLREAEKVHGFNHAGGIQIPCRRSEFEKVQMRIEATGGSGDYDR